MICGHCKGRDASVEHVRQCATQARRTEEAVRAVKRVQYRQRDNVLANEPGDISGVYYARDPREAGRPTYWKVQLSQSSGSYYAKRYDEDGAWEYVGRTPLHFLRATDRITAEEAEAFGHIHGCCIFCLKTLTDERSVVAGYGPQCAAKNGLPWG